MNRHGMQSRSTVVITTVLWCGTMMVIGDQTTFRPNSEQFLNRSICADVIREIANRSGRLSRVSCKSPSRMWR